ncbi:MAG: DNA-directed RNA polymerase subunit beta', partial [Firmicutes bacterium]|nr:DNA-directed RNA polymerase subunit beta' [Bacillota bacterium]
IGLASPEKVREWSRGEVKKPETINYRTLKPEREGLFCEKIFGPTRDWECHCGKYKRVRYKGIICDRCGVEVTRSKVRRERMGHIELAAPVSHIWYFKGIPSRMGLLMDISPRALEKVLYFAAYLVLDPADTPLIKKQILSEAEYREARAKHGAAFRAGMGAEAVKVLLLEINLDEMSQELRTEIRESSGQRKIRATRRLEVVEAFLKSGNHPESMIMDVIPVIPPDLRPMVQLDGGRFATSDLNDLYRRVINRNNRLKRLLDLGAPDIIVRNEKRMLQEAVDALIDNGRRGRPVTGPGNRPLKSLSDMLKGKQGRFRQNLLGKRVDYSGRSVIVIGPTLKFYQCGLPKEMALELFKPFVMKKLVADGHAHNIKSAKRMVERVRPEVWDVLEEVIKEHPVLLNRAPTLHRLGIQAFEPVLVEGRAIQIHPLVCAAYNADFDGDQMAVHVPLSAEAQAEARLLMLSVHNLLNPKDGSPVVTPTQDMVIGIYYLTVMNPEAVGAGKVFSRSDEAMMAYEEGVIGLQAPIKLRAPAVPGIGDGQPRRMIATTVGRLIFNEAIPQDLGYVDRSVPANNAEPEVNFAVDMHLLVDIVARCYRYHGNISTSGVLDRIKELGFAFSTRAGLTVGITDIVIPGQKQQILDEADASVDQAEEQYRKGRMTEEEKYETTVRVWSKAREDVTKALVQTLDPFNPVYMMAMSGARGNIQQICQLAGMRGLMTDPSGRIIALPIKANFREGLTVLEYFISTHGTRKGLADTALRTADSGYLTRRLVDVAQDVIVREEDCGTTSGIEVEEIRDGQEVIETLRERVIGRTSLEDVTVPDLMDPVSGEVISSGGTLVSEGEEINEERADALVSYGVVRAGQTGTVTRLDERTDGWTEMAVTADNGQAVGQRIPPGAVIQVQIGEQLAQGRPFNQGLIRVIRIKSVLTCKSRFGVCIHCYGRNRATGRSVEVGESVGIIAAQSIGEPGTQLTMRTFHTGGVFGEDIGDITQGLPRVEELFEARKPKGQALITDLGGEIKIVQGKTKREIEIHSPDGEVRVYGVPFGARIRVRIGQVVEPGDELTEGSVNPHEVLAIKGLRALQIFLLQEVQRVYRLQGVQINDQHIEIIIRQMMKKVKVDESGDTNLLPGGLVDMFDFEEENARTEAEGGQPATAKPALLGITKASLATDSFLSAASFQETTRVLTDAAIKGKVDPLLGLKENVIIGKLIPAGSGMTRYRNIRILHQPGELEHPDGDGDLEGEFGDGQDQTGEQETSDFSGGDDQGAYVADEAGEPLNTGGDEKAVEDLQETDGNSLAGGAEQTGRARTAAGS